MLLLSNINKSKRETTIKLFHVDFKMESKLEVFCVS